MKFTYRSTQVDPTTERFRNHTYTLDTETWLDHVRRGERGPYGNAADLIEQHVLALLQAGRLEELHAVVFKLYEQWRQHNAMLIFEFAMYVWAGFKAGRYTADVWATVLSIAWPSGSRGMMAAVALRQAQVVEMFRAAPRRTLLSMSEFDGDDLNAQYDSMPESFQVFRGVSTGLDHFEDGFSWTLEPGQAPTFAALNCQNKKEIPGYVLAVVPKEAVLALFSYEREVVVDPTLPKLEVQKYFLRGKELRDFHKRIDVEANTRDVILNTGYAGRHKTQEVDARMAEMRQNPMAGAAASILASAP